jgi:glycine/serine hydroxymethyltransferase
MIEIFHDLEVLAKNFNDYQKNTIPLCAAENIMSDFCKLPLSAGFQERYIMGSAYEYTMDGNFIGSEYLLPFYKMLDLQCNKIFKSRFTDARTLTGMNCLTTILMSISKPGDNIMILGSNYGGHASVKGICERLSLRVYEAPYDLESYDFDYAEMDRIINANNIQFILLAPSDILFPFDLTKIRNDKVVVLYDASQLLGLIGAELNENPLPKMHNMIMFGGTHKTLPGPAHGIALTNNEDLFKIIDSGINPKYLRNTQMHQVICLLFCLIEAEYFGRKYQANIIKTSNLLGEYLDNLGFTIAKRNGVFSMTHQVFIECSAEKMEIIYGNAINAGITLNTKKKALFHGGYGIRLGTQEIARYDWNDSVIATIAEIISLLSSKNCNFEKIKIIKRNIPEKLIKFTFSEDDINPLKKLMFDL